MICLSFACGRSFVVARDYVDSVNALVRRMLASRSYDVTHVDHLQMAQFVPDNGQTLNVLDEHNVEWRIVERIARSNPSAAKRLLARIEYPKLRQFEREMCMRAHYVLTVTDEDNAALGKLVGRVADSPGYPLIETIPIGVDTDYFSYEWQCDRHAKCVFVGTMYWPPNVDSVLHFCRDILPLARSDVPELEFDIVGLRPTKAVFGLERTHSRVRVTGSVDDVRPYMARSRVLIVPLRSGSGMRVKILNAMAAGVPIVTTSIGCEGIEGLMPVEEPIADHPNDNANIWIADSPKNFSRAVVTLTRDDKLARTLSRNGRELVETKYDWSIISKRIVEVYDRIEENIATTGRGTVDH
jgi:glycosyltransferase involved in cell wall biosynthesis